MRRRLCVGPGVVTWIGWVLVVVGASCSESTSPPVGEGVAAREAGGDSAAGRSEVGGPSGDAPGGTGDGARQDGARSDSARKDSAHKDGASVTPPKPTCTSEGGTAAVAKPVLVKNISGTGTSWFGSAAMLDLDGDGKKELVGTFYDIIVWDSTGKELARAKSGGSHSGRIYAPAVVADLDGDKVTEIVAGAGSYVIAYEYKKPSLTVKAGWPVRAAAASESPEVRGLAAADLDGDGVMEVVATTTVGSSGSQVWVFAPSGKLYQPKGLTQWTAWPRYNKLTGTGNDADANGMGHHGYGCYGLNVGIGDLDDDSAQEIVVTYDNHHVNVFNPDGTSKRASSWYKNRDSKYAGKPLDWGQFIRWEDLTVEDNHYHYQTGEWPSPGDGQVWLQWTASPPNVVDVDGDGKNEVLGVANAETNEPYQTVHNSVMVLQGEYGTADRSARRLPGWEVLPHSKAPQSRSGDYPPLGVPAPTNVDLDGDKLPETIVPTEDGYVHCVSSKAKVLWSYDARQGRPLMYASEVTAADLNKDGTVELVLSTWGKPTDSGAGYLVILDASGKQLYSIQVPNQKTNGNGIGLPAAPTIGDLDGDGALEIAVQSFDHGLDLYRVPGSGTKCLPWPTARANLLRNGQGPAYKPAP